MEKTTINRTTDHKEDFLKVGEKKKKDLRTHLISCTGSPWGQKIIHSGTIKKVCVCYTHYRKQETQIKKVRKREGRDI